ncbi:MAG: DUF4010 domain-containing protein, partial [Candidatus Hydrothermarchaeota archaeon]|nr:DUF4010 domain-containing protein [Candidatus Hydrothermarchaeota archaeon]
VYIAAIIGGLVSSAATTASFASLYATGNLDLTTASAACVVSAVGSTLNKITIRWINGTSALSRYLAVPTGLVAFLSLIDLLFKTW